MSEVCNLCKGTGWKPTLEPMGAFLVADYTIKEPCIHEPITRVHDEITLHEGASVHAEHFFWSPLAHAYDYDPADDGPECEVITRILASHPNEVRVR